MIRDDRTRDRIRWHCRRGMLELDLVLNAFVDRHFEALAPGEFDAFVALLEYPDPVLLDFVMGHAEPEAAAERSLLGLVRGAAAPEAARTLSPEPEEGRRDIPGASGLAPFAQH